VGYCPCGQEIHIEYLRRDQGWRPRFTGQEGKEVEHCPHCGRELTEDLLQ
jgi:hypothetical protein